LKFQAGEELQIIKDFVKIHPIATTLMATLFALALPALAEASPAISIEKSTNGHDADTEIGPFILAGETITWNYEITNTGNVDLENITVTDDQEVGVICPVAILEAGASMICTASGTALTGQYANMGTVTGTPPGGLPAVTDSDMSHYFGVSPAISIEKSTNGHDADTEIGPFILAGETITWDYLVTNSGDITLVNVTVTDDQVVEVVCPQDVLKAAEAMTCTASGTALTGQYANTGTVTGTPPGGLPDITDSDMSHYFGVSPGINIEKSTNGQDADTEIGPFILAGETVTWDYLVTNSGDITLVNVTVIDDQGVEVVCPQDVLKAVEAMTCTASGTALTGQYANMGTVTGTPPGGLPDVTDSDMSHYFGVSPGDINADGSIDIQDAILGLRIITNSKAILPFYIVADVNNDGKIGIEEVIYALQFISEIKPQQ
jgi:NAD-dependent dihydropyrimidine dehydrogenase PreA subunit